MITRYFIAIIPFVLRRSRPCKQPVATQSPKRPLLCMNPEWESSGHSTDPDNKNHTVCELLDEKIQRLTLQAPRSLTPKT